MATLTLRVDLDLHGCDLDIWSHKFPTSVLILAFIVNASESCHSQMLQYLSFNEFQSYVSSQFNTLRPNNAVIDLDVYVSFLRLCPMTCNFTSFRQQFICVFFGLNKFTSKAPIISGSREDEGIVISRSFLPLKLGANVDLEILDPLFQQLAINVIQRNVHNYN